MEKISEMIQRLCPEGVEMVRLEEICLSIKTGKLNANAMVEGGIYPFFTCDSKPTTIDDYAFDTEAIIVTGNGSQVGHINYYNGKFNAYQRTYVLSEFKDVRIEYVLHYFKGYLKSYIMENCKKGSIPYITLPMLQYFEIPLSPFPIQQEIVRILDSFTSMITNLETELASRQKQYEYYRNKLLTFDENDETVEWKTLGEIGTVVRGNGLQKSDFSEEGVGCVHYGQIYTRLGFSIDKTLTFVPEDLAEKLTQVEPGNLIIACTSENVEDVCKSVVWLGSETIVTGGHACVFKHNENPKYVGYCFLTNNFFDQKQKYAYGAKVIDIRTEKLALIKIPIPSKERQQEIVSTLDTFESLISNIKQELDARKKQYEYYREKLLTFE